MSQAETFIVEGSEGTLICDAKTGMVLRYDYGSEDDSRGYSHVVCINVEDLRKAYDHPVAGYHFDILDCGFWHTEGDGGYEPPEFDWREQHRGTKWPRRG